MGRKADIPADRTGTGSFYDLEILSEKHMAEIMAGLEAKPYDQLTDEEKKIRDLYDAFSGDTAQIEKRGLAPVQADLTRIEKLKTLDDVARAMGDVSMGGDGLFGGFVNSDAKHPTQYAMIVTHSGLGMPNRDY